MFVNINNILLIIGITKLINDNGKTKKFTKGITIKFKMIDNIFT